MEKKIPSRIKRKRSIKNKKNLIGIFVAIFAFAFSMFYAFAGENPTITLTKIDSASRGDQITFSVDLTNNKEYSALGFTLNYDASALEFIPDDALSYVNSSSNNDTGRPNYSFSNLDDSTASEGQLMLFFAFTNGKTANSDNKLGEITFKVKDGAAGKYDITVDNIKMELINDDESTTALNVTASNGYVKVLVPVDQSSVKLEKNEYEIQKGSTDTIKVLYTPEDTTDDKTFTYSSSDDNVAIVDNTGKVTAKTPGIATITVNAFGKTLSADVTVVAHITKVTVNGSKTELYKGEELQLNATINPNDTTDDKTLTWKSSNTEVATVDSTGKVKTLKGGETTITATSTNNVVGTYNIKVVVPITEFATSDTNVTLTRGNTKKINTTINPSDTTEDKTVTWTSSDTTVATVDSTGTVTAISGGSAKVTGALSNGKKVEVTVNVVIPLEKVELDKTSVELLPTQKQTLIATITPKDTTEDKTIAWTSSDTTIATVSNGEVTAINPGTVTITAKVGEKTATATVKVLKPIDSVVISESEVTLNRNDSKKLTVTILPEDAEEDKTVTWISSDPSSVSVAADGTIKGLKGTQSPVTITGTLENGKKVECKVTVVVLIESIKINKTNTVINKGESETLSVTINPSDTSEDTTVTWTSSDTTVATVDSTGKVSALKAGNATITAKVGSFVKECAVEVKVPITSVEIDSENVTLPRGNNKTLSVIVNPSDTTENKKVTWTSSDNSIATVDANGVVTAVDAGTVTITAKVGSKTDKVKVTVIVPITEFTIADSETEIIKGETKALTTTINPSDTTEDTTITWTSADTSIATVDSTGKVTGVAEGTAKITGTLKNGKKVECSVTVKIIPVEEIEVSEEILDMKKKETKTLSVSYKPTNATEVTNIIWSSSDETVVTVDSNGKVIALKEGTATITAKMGNLTDTVEVTVTEVALEGISLEENETTLKVGKAYKLSLKLNPIDATDDITYTYTSSDESIATVDNEGNITSKKEGTVIITVKASNGISEFEDSIKLKIKAPDSPQTGVTSVWIYGVIILILSTSAFIVFKRKKLF